MSDLPEIVERTIRERDLFSPGQRILVAVSGGLDSMVLLRLLHDLSESNGWRLVVAHLNHRLRGRSSAADERLVRRAARQLGLPTVIEREDVRAISRERKLSLEMAARKARHDFLARVAVRLRIRTVALAHHADDQVEQFFLRVLRGAGSEGLAGMKWRNPSPSSRGVGLVRPLLALSKEALRQYAAAHKIAFREDATNASLEIQRNRVRHELLPLLRRKYQSSINGTIGRVMEIVGAEADFAGCAAAAWLEQMRSREFRVWAQEQAARKPRGEPRRSDEAPKDFSELHVAVQRRCVQLQLLELGIAGDYDLIEALRKRAGQLVAVGPSRLVRPDGLPQRRKDRPGGFSVLRTAIGRLELVERNGLEFDQDQVVVDLGQPGQAEFCGLRLRWSFQRKQGAGRSKQLTGKELFDADKVGAAVILRHWHPGDRFQPIGLAKVVKLQDFFTNQKVPPLQRRQLTLATTDSGEIFWIEGMRISERFKLTAKTIRRLLWAWERF